VSVPVRLPPASITDDQVAALRAYLAGDFETHQRLHGQLDPVAAQSGYTALIAGAFFEAVDRRFAQNDKEADVVEFVGSVRSRSDRLANELDPQIAERLIRHSLGHGSIADIDDETVVQTQIVLLAGLIADEDFSATDLDKFMTTARALGDRLMA
jgi:hypothetical protein